MAALLAGCITRPVVYASDAPCSALVPPGWSQPTPGAELPEGDTVGSWQKFSDAQTAQLDKANVEKVEGIGIVKRCEARDAAVIAKARKGKL
jgi:hypothetical protein